MHTITANMEYITYRNKIVAITDGEEVGEVTFPMTGENTYNINHTYVDNRLRGQGIASELVRRAVEEIERRGGHKAGGGGNRAKRRTRYCNMQLCLAMAGAQSRLRHRRHSPFLPNQLNPNRSSGFHTLFSLDMMWLRKSIPSPRRNNR